MELVTSIELSLRFRDDETSCKSHGALSDHVRFYYDDSDGLASFAKRALNSSDRQIVKNASYESVLCAVPT